MCGLLGPIGLLLIDFNDALGGDCDITGLQGILNYFCFTSYDWSSLVDLLVAPGG